MTKAEEKRREKARALRYRKPAVKDLNIAEILEQLTEIEEECAEVHWYCDSEDGWDTLLNALDNDDDDAWEFKTAFADLEGQCEKMRDDLTDDFSMAMGVTEINGVNYDWAFQFSIKDVPVEWNHMPLTVEELNAGDLIAVTYTGSILEISPAIIENVLLVRLLKGI